MKHLMDIMQKDILALKKTVASDIPRLNQEVDTMAGDVTALNAFAMEINSKTKP